MLSSHVGFDAELSVLAVDRNNVQKQELIEVEMCEQLGFRTSLPGQLIGHVSQNWLEPTNTDGRLITFWISKIRLKNLRNMSSVQIDGAGDGTNLETDPLGVNLRTKPNFTFFFNNTNYGRSAGLNRRQCWLYIKNNSFYSSFDSFQF